MSTSALIAFFIAWATQGQSICMPPSVVTLRPVQEFRSPCNDAPQHPCNLAKYRVYTAFVDQGHDRTVYQVRITTDARSGDVRGYDYTKDGHRAWDAPPLSSFVTNDANGTIWPRTVPATCDLPVLEGYDP